MKNTNRKSREKHQKNIERIHLLVITTAIMRRDTEIEDTPAIPTVKRRQKSPRNTKRKIGNARNGRIDYPNIQNPTTEENPRNIKVLNLDHPANDERK